MAMGKPRITFTIEPAAKDALEAIATKDRRSLADVIRIALDEYIRSQGAGQLRLFPDDASHNLRKETKK